MVVAFHFQAKHILNVARVMKGLKQYFLQYIIVIRYYLFLKKILIFQSLLINLEFIVDAIEMCLFL